MNFVALAFGSLCCYVLMYDWRFLTMRVRLVLRGRAGGGGLLACMVWCGRHVCVVYVL